MNEEPTPTTLHEAEVIPIGGCTMATTGAINGPHGMLKPSYGETPARVRSLANGDAVTGGEWIDRWTWDHHENRTRYDLIYGRRSTGEFILGNFVDGSGRFMVIHDPGYTWWGYVMDKLVLNKADAVGVLGFLEFMGHAVGYPND